MKVLFICSSLQATGPTSQLLNIARYVSKKTEFSIMTLSHERSNTMIDRFLALENINLHLYGEYSISQMFNIIKGADIIHTQGVKSDFLSALFFWKKRISTLRNHPFDDYPKLYGDFIGSMMAATQLLALKTLTKRVSVSESTSRKNQSVSRSEYKTIINGVDIERFSNPDLCKVEQIRTNLKLSNSDKVLIYVGDLIPRKNVSAVINAVNDNPDYKLLIVGDGPERTSLEVISKENIIFTGSVNDVENYLSVADRFVMMSHSEGFPNVAMEAIASGIPCILSNIPSHIDVKKVIPDYIQLVDCTSDLSCLLKKGVLQQSYSSKIKQVAVDKLSSDNMARNYLKLYSLTHSS